MIGPSLARKSSKRNRFQPTSRIHSGPWNIDAIRNTFDGSRMKTKRGARNFETHVFQIQTKQFSSAQRSVDRKQSWDWRTTGIWPCTLGKHVHKKLWMFYDCGSSIDIDVHKFQDIGNEDIRIRIKHLTKTKIALIAGILHHLGCAKALYDWWWKTLFWLVPNFGNQQ